MAAAFHLVYVPVCFTDCVGVVHYWLYVAYPDVLFLLAFHLLLLLLLLFLLLLLLLLLLLFVLLLAEYCWPAAWCPAVLTAPAHARCLAAHLKCASVHPTVVLASPAWPSHPILPAYQYATLLLMLCYIRAITQTHSRWATSAVAKGRRTQVLPVLLLTLQLLSVKGALWICFVLSSLLAHQLMHDGYVVNE
jgi:hypothetical protein